MNLTKYDPFQNFFGKLNTSTPSLFPFTFPVMSKEASIDAWEDENKIVIEVECSGMSMENINLTLNKNVLTISGERSSSKEREEGKTLVSERWLGTFTRDLKLPHYADLDSLDASLSKGILRIEVKKRETTEPKKIEIKEGE